MIDDQLVYARIVLPGPQLMCTADGNPHTYLLAVERGVLPESPFRVQLAEAVIDESEVTEVDLR